MRFVRRPPPPIAPCRRLSSGAARQRGGANRLRATWQPPQCRAVEIERDDESGISQEEFSSVDVELDRESV